MLTGVGEPDQAVLEVLKTAEELADLARRQVVAAGQGDAAAVVAAGEAIRTAGERLAGLLEAVVGDKTPGPAVPARLQQEPELVFRLLETLEQARTATGQAGETLRSWQETLAARNREVAEAANLVRSLQASLLQKSGLLDLRG